MNAVEAFVRQAQQMDDPRGQRRTHLLGDLLTSSLLSTISQGEGWQDMALFAAAHEDWLRQFLELPGGPPCKDTFRRVISRLEPEKFSQLMAGWLADIAQTCQGRLIPIDGKTLRGAIDRANNQAGLHLVSAFLAENRLTLAQTAVAEKSNEITAIPRLLELIDIRGAVVSIDAMGCQKAIAKQIREQQGDYLLGVKDNQPKLAEACRERMLEYHDDRKSHAGGDSHCEEPDLSHGRRTQRECHVVPLPVDSPVRENWKGAEAVVQVISVQGGESAETVEIRYYLASFLCAACLMATYVRGHWSIENTLHWVLDVTFREDACRIHKDHGPANIAALRRLSAGLLQQETERQLAKSKPSKLKLSMRQKKLLAAWNKDYLIQLLTIQ